MTKVTDNLREIEKPKGSQMKRKWVAVVLGLCLAVGFMLSQMVGVAESAKDDKAYLQGICDQIKGKDLKNDQSIEAARIQSWGNGCCSPEYLDSADQRNSCKEGLKYTAPVFKKMGIDIKR